MPFSLMQEMDMKEGTGESGAGKQAPCRRLHAPLTHAARMSEAVLWTTHNREHLCHPM